MDSKQEDAVASNGDKTMPLFFFFSCKTSGTDFMKHKILDLAVHCWPYKEDAPMFYSRVHHNCRSGDGSTQQNNSPGSGSCGTNSNAATVISKLLKWIDDTTSIANAELGLSLHPVLLAHGGETFAFLFLFRMLESYDIDPRNILEAHNIHYADPFPTLQQFKDAKHPWLLQSRSLGLGSLLNDWFPAQFTDKDLLYSRSRGALIVKLYTQCSLHWLLYWTPIYNTKEWIEFYEGKKYYREDKLDLQEHVPTTVVGLQRKLTIKHLLKHGYNWTRLINLFTSCGSLQHFRQELRDMDIKTGAARRITLRLNEMALEQDGSREYKIRIKSNMPYAKYYHLTGARGRHFILRVANVLPPCICSLIDPPNNQWKVPENLLQINLSDIWDPKTGLKSRKEMMDNCQDGERLHDVEVEGHHGDGGKEQNADQSITPLEESDSDVDWEVSSDPENQCLDENGELLDSYIKEQAYCPTTTLQKGLPGVNPFRDPSNEWLFEEVPERHEECQKELSLPASNSQSNTEDLTLLTNQMSSSRLSDFKSSNQKDSSEMFNAASANQRPSGRAFYSTSSDSTSSSKLHHSTSSNQMFSNQLHHSMSANHRSSSSSKRCHSKSLANSNHSTQANNISSTNRSSPAGCMKTKMATGKHSNSPNQMDEAGSHDFHPINQDSSADFTRRSKHSTSGNHSRPKHPHHRRPTNPGLPADFASSTESHHFTSAKETGSKHSNHRRPTNAGLPADFTSSTESHHFTSAKETGSKHSNHRRPTNAGLPADFASSTESHHFTSAKETGSKHSNHRRPTNAGLPADFASSTESHHFTSAKETGSKQTRHRFQTNHDSPGESL